MPIRSRTSRKTAFLGAQAVTDEADRRLLETLHGAAINGLPVALKAPCTLAVKNPGGAYRQQKFAGNEDFMLSGVREGKRSQFILCFEPVDPIRDVEIVEMLDKDYHKYVKDVNALTLFLSNALGYPDLSYEAAKKKFVRELRKETLKAEILGREKEAQELASKYADNPLWGSW